MLKIDNFPHFNEDLPDFLADLRAQIFSSKLEAARHFKLARPTISRYESGQLTPPFGYVASLALLNANNLFQREEQALEAYKRNLLQEVNKVLRWYYREKAPYQKPLQSWDELERIANSYQAERQETKSAEDKAETRREDWGEAIETTVFYGRTEELTLLESWILNERCRLVSLLGMGGIGKTTLATRLATQIKEKFDFFLWKSLRNAPPLENILADCIYFLLGQTEDKLPSDIDSRISLLLEALRQHRCLLVLDNLETIMELGQLEGDFRVGYQEYGHFLKRIGNTPHQSCVVITSREKPAELDLLEGKNTPVRSLALSGLSIAAGQQILAERELNEQPEAMLELTNRYSGHPLALKLVSSIIAELFGGDIEKFLREGALIFGDVNRLLEQQFNRLSELQQSIMYWLAIGRELCSLAELQQKLLPTPTNREMMDSLQALRRRFLIERNDSQATTGVAFTQQPVVMEYVTTHLIERMTNAILENNLDFLASYALVVASDHDYIRAAQTRLILKPVLDYLQATFKNQAILEQHLQKMLDLLRVKGRAEQGYAGGNTATMLLHLRGNLRNMDFSGLNIWQTYLQGVDLQNADFSQADLSDSVFSEVFDAVRAVAFSSDGELLAAGSSNGEIYVWRVIDCRLIANFKAHSGNIQTLAFSPINNYLISGSTDRLIKLWRIADSECLWVGQGHEEWVWSVSFSSDGSFVCSSCGDQTLRLWSVETGKCLQVLHGHNSSVRAMSLSPDKKILASGGGDCLIKLWRIESDYSVVELEKLEGHSGWVQTLTFNADGSVLASGGEDGTIRLWRIENEKATLIKCWQAHGGEWIWSLAFSSDGTKLISGGGDRRIKLWDVASGQCLKIMEGHQSLVRTVAFNPKSSLIASGSGDHTVRLWDVASGQALRTLQGYSNPLRSVAFHPNRQQLITADGDCSLKIWNIDGSDASQTLVSYGETTWSVKFSPDGKIIAGGNDEGNIRLWDAESGQVLGNLSKHEEWVQSIAFSPDGRILASGSGDRTVKLWEVATNRCLKTLRGHSEWIWAVAFSPDGKTLASGGGKDGTIRLWDSATGECRAVMQSPDEWVLALNFSPNNQILASGSENGVIRLWDTHTLQAQTLEGYDCHIWSLVFSHDGKFLATGGEDGTVWLWDCVNKRCQQILIGHSGWVWSVDFSSDGRFLASCGEDGTVRVWEVSSGECQRVFYSERPYENLNISKVRGLSEGQKANLKILGAFEKV